MDKFMTKRTITDEELATARANMVCTEPHPNGLNFKYIPEDNGTFIIVYDAKPVCQSTFLSDKASDDERLLAHAELANSVTRHYEAGGDTAWNDRNET